LRRVDPAQHGAKRRQILRAAARLFAARGFDNTSTAEIAARAGMSSGNLFHYFSSKREIFAAIFEEGRDDKAARLAAAGKKKDPWAGLLEVVDVLALPATRSVAPPLVMEAMLQARRDPKLAKRLSRDDAAEHAAIEALVARGIAAGRIDARLDARAIASWIMTLIGSLYLRAAIDRRFKPKEQLPVLKLMLERFTRPRR
jgi:AcrR family transcriptional regulator